MTRASDRRDAYEPVTGQVRNTELKSTNPDPGDGTGRQFAPVITYEYAVEGETYSNDNLYPGPATAGSSDRNEQEEILDRYPEGETVEAYYDPNDPSVSFLEKESRKRQGVALGMLGGGLLVFGLAIVMGIPF